MADKVEQISNDNFFTFVVDPNPPNGDVHTPEDLFVWVNFRALPKSRSVIETDGTYATDSVSSKGVQFVTSTEQNGKGYATTNFTNIGGAQSSEREAFGIEEISMEYGSSLVPQVKIKFIDVRGAALFNGYEYEDEKGMKYNSSEFSSFFRLPYPVFELSVKGFYGKAVTYCLHLKKWNASFDAGTGNFVIDAEFVGYTFAFLADVLMKYVMSVTSSDIGASALAKAGVMSLNDFLISLGKLTRIAEEFKDGSDEYRELIVINSILYKLDKLLKTIGNPTTIDTDSEFGKPLPFPQLQVNRDQVFVRDVGIISEESSDIHDVIIEDLEKYINEYNAKEIDKNKGEFSYITKYKIDSFDISTPALSYEINDSTVDEIIAEVAKNEPNNSLNTVTTSTLLSRFNLKAGASKKFYIINYGKFRKQVSDLKSEVGDKKNELERVVNESLNKKLGVELGFNLTIDNVFKIILGNVEAFLEVVYDIAKEADNPTLQKQRIGSLENIRTDINPDDERIYPFPALYDSTTGDEIWIGDVVGEDNDAFPEIRLIREVMNAIVASNNTQTKNRVTQNTSGNVNQQGDGWIPVNPVDYANNELADIDSLSLNGNAIPVALAESIVTRAIATYDYTLYQQGRLNNFAQMDGAYAASQITNDTYKQFLKTFNSDDFVSQIITSSGFPDKQRVNILNNIDFTTNQGTYLGGYSDADDDFIDDVMGQQSKVLPEELDKTIRSFGKNIDDILIPTAQQKLHRKLDGNSLIVKGDVTDLLWRNDVYKNIEKFHKGRTSSPLKNNKTYNSAILAPLNDLTVIDGQINAIVDYTKGTNREEKFTNIGRVYIGKNLIEYGAGIQCLFDSVNYQSADDKMKAYQLLLTFPLEKISDFEKLFDLAGLYEITEIQLAWVSAQFWRASEFQTNNVDVFDAVIDIITADKLAGVLITGDYNILLNGLNKLKKDSLKFLPDLTKYSDEFIGQMFEYYGNWITTKYINTTEVIAGIDEFINYIASWENYNGYTNYGLTSSSPDITYGIPVTEFNNLLSQGISGAVSIYKKVYLPLVSIVPLDMQPMALDMAINQHDPLGYVLATANRMGVTAAPDFNEVRDRWFGEGVYVGNAQKDIPYPTEYLTTISAIEYGTHATVINTLFNNDKLKFLDELAKTRLMVYSRTPSRDDIRSSTGISFFQEWASRTISINQYGIDFIKARLQENEYYYKFGTTFLKSGENLAIDLNNGADSQDNIIWYAKVRSTASKYLLDIKPQNSSLHSTGFENAIKGYCTYTKYGIQQSSTDYNIYKKFYNDVLKKVNNIIEILIINVRKSFNIASDELNETQLSQYLKRWHTTFKQQVRFGNVNGIKTNNNSTISTTQNFYVPDKDIKIATYRHFKNLYDKWIGGNIDERVHNSCSYGGGSPRTSKLFDRFHFIDRTWSHIGDRAVINPKPLMILSKKNDINLYMLIGVLLKDSNFDFHVLPSWVNYKNLDDVYDMWKPHTDVENASSGASYIAMYMAGSSKVLDIGSKAFYLNDGFDLRSHDQGNIPEGFKDRRTPANIDDLEDNEKFKYNMVIFRVGYADQNQSIFQNITDLTQQEHRETAESLQAMSENVDNRGGTKRFYKGVNLYNVFALRSYQCTVTCMGNMQIHPLTYFQLDNIPFFHGAYLITKVRHTIRAHFIETSFTGRRVPRFVYPIVENATSYVEIPLSDTLFSPDELRKPVVRSLNGDNSDAISIGENTSFNERGEGLATANEIARGQEANNSLMDVVFGGETFNFWIQDDVTTASLDADIASVFNPNNPKKFKGVGLGDCYGWTKRAMKSIGVIQDEFYGIDAWTFFTGWNDPDFKFIDPSIFADNLGGWTNQKMIDAGIPDGSFIAAYYPTSNYFYRAIDRMINTGVSAEKIQKLMELRDLDTKTNYCKRGRAFCDPTPNSKKLFSHQGYKNSHNESRWENPPVDNTQIPFVPVTHSMLFINSHCFHQLEYVWTRPSSSVRIVGYYPFKKKLYDKVKNK